MDGRGNEQGSGFLNYVELVSKKKVSNREWRWSFPVLGLYPHCLIIVVVGGMDHISKTIANAMPRHPISPNPTNQPLGYFVSHRTPSQPNREKGKKNRSELLAQEPSPLRGSAHALGVRRATPPRSLLLLVLAQQRLDIAAGRLAGALLSNQALEPCVLRLELADAGLELLHAVAHLLGGLLERLLALLLLDAEAGGSGCVAAALVLLGGAAGGLVEVVEVGGADAEVEVVRGLALPAGVVVAAQRGEGGGRRGVGGEGVCLRERGHGGVEDGRRVESGEVGELEVGCEEVEVSHGCCGAETGRRRVRDSAVV
jgi:hypothetical protein